MLFARNEWSGAKAVFEKFAGLHPRAGPASWLAGVTLLVDRRMIIMPDPHGSAALQTRGRLWETPITDW